jgi:hypothetical protein
MGHNHSKNVPNYSKYVPNYSHTYYNIHNITYVIGSEMPKGIYTPKERGRT